jgi:hypothetical protein
MPSDTQELDKAIAAAAEKIKSGKTDDEVVEKKVEKKSDKVEEEKPEVELEIEAPEGEEAEEEEDFSESEADESKRLYKALKDPKTAGPIIAALAQQAGILTGKQPETKAEEKKATRDVKAILSEALGEYKFLADKLGPAIESILQQERESNEVKFAEQAQHRIEGEVVSATDKLSRETKGESRKLEAKMNELSQEIPIGTMSVETYVRRLYTIAAADKVKTAPKQISDRIRRNANDATARIQGTRGQDMPVGTIPKGKMNINQAVNWALASIASGKKE